MKRITWLLRLACLAVGVYLQFTHPLDLSAVPLVMLATGGGSMLGKGYIDPLLSSFAITYRPHDLIAADVMPIIPVVKQSGIFAKLESADQFRIPDTSRAPGDEAKRVRFRVGSDNYNCVNYALKTVIPIEDLANAQPPFLQMLEQSRTGTIMNQLMLDWENRIASNIFFNSSAVGSAVAVTSAWGIAGGNGSPFNDINVAADNVHNATGYYPNVIIFGRQAWFDYRRHNETINKTQRTAQPGGAPIPNETQVAAQFDLPPGGRVFVGRGAYKNTAQEGISQTLVPVWGSHVFVGYMKMDAVTTEDPTYAAAFRWSVPGVPALQVERLPYDARIKAEELEVGYYQTEKVTASALGFLVQSVH